MCLILPQLQRDIEYQRSARKTAAEVFTTELLPRIQKLWKNWLFWVSAFQKESSSTLLGENAQHVDNCHLQYKNTNDYD